MGVTNSARNTAGFSSCVQLGQLPPASHFPFQGVFNELRYDVGPKTQQVLDIHHGYARFRFEESKFDSDIHDYLALFLKGKADGEVRDPNRRLNSVVCLDISGSMNCGLGSSSTKHNSRISLCIEAIKMFISKLEPQDSFGLTTFDNEAHLIFAPTLKKDIDEGIYSKIDEIKACGGNTLIDGFRLSKKLLLKQMQKQHGGLYQNRVVILSDVCDTSITHAISEIKQTAHEYNVHLSIIGISTDFNSKTCEALKDTKGFNYFCATNEQHIMKYMFETFDYAFFPCASNINLTLESDCVDSIQVFGAPDAVEEILYQEPTNDGLDFVISRIQTVFPSQIQIDKNIVYTVGGLIIVKIKRKTKGSVFDGKIKLSYQDIEGHPLSQIYPIHYQFHPQEQFLSSQCLLEALNGFVFTSEIRSILEASQKIDKQQIYVQYKEMIDNLEKLCPESKIKQFKKIQQTIETYKEKPKIGVQELPEAAKQVKEQVKIEPQIVPQPSETIKEPVKSSNESPQ